MIDSCVNCCKKHLRKAMVLWLETRLGHPENFDRMMGNLAEAADAIVLIDESVALFLREQYLKLEADTTIILDWRIIFETVNSIRIKSESGAVDKTNLVAR